jgi:hypothetical protein
MSVHLTQLVILRDHALDALCLAQAELDAELRALGQPTSARPYYLAAEGWSK